MCLRFHYLYREAGNFKRFGFVDFLVSQIPDLFSELEFVKSHLVDGLYFDPRDFFVPNLYFAPFDRDLDHNLIDELAIGETVEKFKDITENL